MNRKLTVLLLAALLLAAGAGPALAAGPRTSLTADLPGTQYFTMVGFITAKDDGTGVLSVDVVHGNRFSQSLIGKEDALVKVNDSTEFRRWTPIGCVPSSWEEIEEGDTVSVHGYVVEGRFEANRVTINVPLICCTP